MISRLLNSPAHTTHLANTWRNVLLPNGADPSQIAAVVGLQNWLRSQFVENTRYDRIVADLMVAEGGRAADPALFFTSIGVEPEKLATATARTFLGVQLDCAQCHDHPFDVWTQHDFWGYAAFFARVEQSDGGGPTIRLIDRPQGEVMLPDSEAVVSPTYPGGNVTRERPLGTRRQQLALWIASRNNLYLARATVNRVWGQLFGRGLVEPVDDLGPHNPASHPEILDSLSEYFILSGYDLKNLYGLLTTTSAYQLSSKIVPGDVNRPELFHRMQIKPMTAEQLYDSLMRVVRRKVQTSANRETLDPIIDPRRREFVASFQSPQRGSLDYQAGVPQALSLMNGSEMAEATDADRSGLLLSLSAPWLDDAARLDSLFLASLSRFPRPTERSKFEKYFESSDSPEDVRAKTGDVLWALLNSAEFSMNH